MKLSPHSEGKLDLDTEQGKLEAKDWIEKYIWTRIPDEDNCEEEDYILKKMKEDKKSKKIIEKRQKYVKRRAKKLSDLVRKLQTHKCTVKYCGKNKCRHDYPKPTSTETRLKKHDDPGNKARFYITKRPKAEDGWINAYNPDILHTWKANMDIQLVGSIYGLCSYICTYVCKSEPDGLRRSIQTALEDLPADATSRRKLARIGNVVFSHREISAQEAGFLLCHIPLVDSSREVVYCPSKLP